LIDVKPDESLDVQLGLLLAMLDDGTEEWRSEIEDLPQEAITWQPFTNGHSIGGVILHIADVEAHWIHNVAAGRTRSEEELKRLLAEETQQYNIQWPTPPNESLDWYWNQCDEIRKKTHELVREMADPEHIGSRPERATDYTLRWMLHHVIGHEAYHGGQAVLLALEHTARG
jgi:uncharacterized damage-inducible protein DinB